ncbi:MULTISPECIES: hypothetical protein [unclassified Micromonospora]|uniref:hypothetical protein n=1 Tax=unclassified Micromonospora TaxID=2617518 RepID=UPI0022B6E864|nr:MULTISPECIES: hypothetical protein [unclassified Micromonospora]MCZ7418887.1 hypothetical protein [Verrucosispora sp. WMMA2121]WBB92574.1 hypothetical protein O7597_06105 [Verrucosispora sp. WMMC514]
MAENYTDPSGNTEAFRAFANPEAAPAETASRTGLIIGAAVVAAVLLALATWLAFG